MKSYLRNYMRIVFDQVRQSTEAYLLNMEGDISSLQTAIVQDIPGMWAYVTERLHSVRRDVSDLGRSPFSQ